LGCSGSQAGMPEDKTGEDRHLYPKRTKNPSSICFWETKP
jgi:hypothetical protein